MFIFYPWKVHNGLICLHMDLETSCHKRKIFEKEARWVMKYIKENRKRAKNEGTCQDTEI